MQLDLLMYTMLVYTNFILKYSISHFRYKISGTCINKIFYRKFILYSMTYVIIGYCESCDKINLVRNPIKFKCRIHFYLVC